VLVVIKDGEIQYEYYDQKYSKDQPHVLWSLSKTITGALLGIAVRDGKLNLSQKLADFYPEPNRDANFGHITLQNLFYLDTGFVWDEYYTGNVQNSPVINMLYASGHTDMARFAASRPIIPEGPGYKWNYSTGTPTLTMGVLKNVYGDEYKQMPWKSLFNPLGMKNTVFEQDASGTFIGGSSVFATPRDIAKIAYLYLNHGQWNGQVILPEEWIQKTLTPSPGYISDGTVIHDITDDGVYGGSIWLNHAIKPGFGRPYPYSPEDMYLGLGHFGQLMIMLPSQNMVIARTGYDEEYNSKVDEFVSRAISCFSNPNYPIGKNIPPPKSEHVGIKQIFQVLFSGIRDDIIQAAVAKSVCSCHFVSKVDVSTCVERSNVPLAKETTRVSLNQDSVEGQESLFASLLGFHHGKQVHATYDEKNPQFGCTLQ